MNNHKFVWETLFKSAFRRLSQAWVPHNLWSFGGGTVLMLKYNHRYSKDIDIFFRDPQLLSSISPRLNDSEEEKIIDYSEHTQFTKTSFPEGEIDFIVSPQLTGCWPTLEEVCGKKVYMDSPVEIVAKKIHFRAEEFKPRDVYDLAVVYSTSKEELLNNASAFKAQLGPFETRIEAMAASGSLDKRLQMLDMAPGGEDIRGSELFICRQFLLDAAEFCQRNNENGAGDGSKEDDSYANSPH